MSRTRAKTPADGAVLVTGASSGIGRACALHLDRLGFRVLAGVRQAAAGDALRRAASDRLAPVALDVADAGSVRSAVDAVTAAVGEAGLAGLAGLVNNAGITVWGPLEFVPLDELWRQFEVSVFGQLAVTQAVLPLLRAGRGRVVNIGSLSGQVALPFYGPYAAAKFAVEALNDVLRVELRPWGIRVALIEPGIVATPIWEKALAAADEWMREAPPAMPALYGPAIEGVRRHARRLARASFPPADVARSVGRALTAGRPRARYRVGQSAQTRLLLLLARLPPRLRDGVIARTLPKYP